MRTVHPWLSPLASLVALLACRPESDPVTFELQAHSFKNSDWSVPVNLGAAINTAFNEQAPTLSKDGLAIYFFSDRPGGLGATDLWVSHRGCVDCPWETAVNLGPVVNTSAGEAGPELSIDGHLLFFVSNREGGHGLNDIYVSRRADPKDDFGWGPPTNLGPDVNTPAFEAGPSYLQSAEDGAANLYFNRGPSGGAQDIYYAPVTRDGQTRGAATLVAELSDPTANDAASTVRTDGREVLFGSSRAGGLGGMDVWVSTRRSVHDPWSTPENLGTPMNSAVGDLQPNLSSDGRTLHFISARPGGLGGFDIWMTTRTPSGKEVP